MKPKATLLHFLALAGSSLLAISSASANTRTWGGGDLNWTNTTASGWNGTAPTTSATINSGTVTVTTNITTGSTPGTIALNGGMLVISTGKLVSGSWSAGKTLTIGSGATLRLNNWGYDVAGTLGALDFGRDRLVVNGGVIELTGNSSESGRNFTVGTGGATLRSSMNSGQTWTLNRDGNPLYHDIQVNSSRTLTLDGTSNGVIENTIVSSSGTGNITKAGAGTWTLTAANTYTGATTVSAGTLQLGNNTATGSLTGTSSITVTGATLAVNRNNAFTQATGLNNKAITGTGGFTQAGSGTTTLSLANTYEGATAVNAGTLEISAGNINSSSGVTVASGATFIYNSSTALTTGITNNGGTIGGIGDIGVPVVLNSTTDILAPGNSPGIQEYTVGQSWASFTYEWEVNDFNGTTAGTDYDQIQITNPTPALGTLTLTGSTAGAYVLDLVSLAGLTAGNVADFSETTTSWNILTTTGGIIGFDEAYWSINDTGFTSSPAWGGDWSLSATSNNLVLTYTAVPEPGAALLGSLGILLLLRRRRA
jgi:autotransporter-associated beta strand protein